MFQRADDYLDSYYVASTRDRHIQRPHLDTALDVNVVIIGAGFTGLYTALNLAEAGKSVAIIESSRVGWAASGRNGGQIILGFSCDMPPFESAELQHSHYASNHALGPVKQYSVAMK